MASPDLRPRLDGRRRTPLPVRIAPDAASLARLAADLDLAAIRKLTFTGTLTPEGRADWRLDADLGATVVQPCGITLDPVTTRIDVPVRRLYREDLVDAPMPDEQEVPEHDEAEPLPVALDLWGVMSEALALAVPEFPRAPGAAFEDSAPPSDTQPADEHPFAGLQDMMRRT